MSSFINWATRSSFSSGPIRWCVQWGLVNGHRVNIEAIARVQAIRFTDYPGVQPHQITCTAKSDGEGVDVSSLKIWLNTETHGKWFMHRATKVVKQILCDEFGGQILWFKR